MRSVPAPLNQVRLAECEKVIGRGLDAFVSVGNALVEIRDDKLYRQTHETFADYCRDRWDLGRARAYQLIDHARTVAVIETASGVCLPAVDISERDTREIKAELPAVVEDIRARVASGEAPNKAAADAIQAKRDEKAEAKKARDAEDEANRARRQEAIDSLPDDVKVSMAAREAHRTPKPTAEREAGTPLSPPDRLAELEDAVAYLEGENARLTARLAELQHLETLEVLYRQGGFDAVLAAKDEVLASKDAMLGIESAEKVKAQRSSDFWRRKAMDLGYSSTTTIPMDSVVVPRGRDA